MLFSVLSLATSAALVGATGVFTPRSLLARQSDPVDPASIPSACQQTCLSLTSCTSVETCCASDIVSALSSCTSCLVTAGVLDQATADQMTSQFDADCAAIGGGSSASVSGSAPADGSSTTATGASASATSHAAGSTTATASGTGKAPASSSTATSGSSGSSSSSSKGSSGSSGSTNSTGGGNSTSTTNNNSSGAASFASSAFGPVIITIGAGLMALFSL